MMLYTGSICGVKRSCPFYIYSEQLLVSYNIELLLTESL